jgi:uncharacterized membrane protein
MLILLLVTVVLIALRLMGQTNSLYKSVAHVYVGGLTGYVIGVHAWQIILQVVLLCAAELYMVAVKFFPQLAVKNLVRRTK